MARFRIPSPSIPDLVFLALALGVPLALSQQLLNSDGDLGRHIRVGEYILGHGLLHKDIFSFTRLGNPFVGYEWLSEVLTALAYRYGGLPLVAACCGLLIGATYRVVARLLLREGVDPFLAYVTAMLAAIIGSVHWLARPHLFTLLGVALVMSLLERGRDRDGGSWGARVWAVIPLFAVWANLHGGFLFGLIVIGVYIAGDLAEAVTTGDRARWLARARGDAKAMAAAAFGTLLTPYGIHLPLHVLGWFRNKYVIDHTGEYFSPDFHDFTNKVVLTVLLMIVAALALSRQRPSYPRLFLILLTIATGLIYQRNIPLIGLTALPVLALHIDGEWRMLRDLGGIRGVFARDNVGRRDGPWAVAIGLLLLLLTVGASPLSRLGLVRARLDPKVFPVAAVEKAREAGLSGRVYNDFIWGGYMLLKWPEQKVFIDGQTDFYGDELTRTHGNIAALTPGWRDLLKKWDISLVMVPGQGGLAHQLVRDPAWSIWYCDSTAVILQKGDGHTADPIAADSAEKRLFTCAPPAKK